MTTSIEICFNPIHEAFTSEVALFVHQLTQSDPLIKVVILVLEAFNLDPQQHELYQLRKCNYGNPVDCVSESILDPSKTIQSLGLKQGDGQRLFLRRKISHLTQLLGRKAEGSEMGE